MRTVLAITVLILATHSGMSQPPPKQGPDVPVVRYGQPYRPKGYPQATPKQTLESVITAAEKGEFLYLAAHLVDPDWIDARVNARAQNLEGLVEDELIQLREKQKPVLDQIVPEARVPTDIPRFKALVAVRTRERAFRQIATDIHGQFVDNPEGLKDLRRCLRWGTFPADAAGLATFTQAVPDPREPTMLLKDRAIFLKRIDDRWFMENRQVDVARPPQPKPPEDKNL